MIINKIQLHATLKAVETPFFISHKGLLTKHKALQYLPLSIHEVFKFKLSSSQVVTYFSIDYKPTQNNQRRLYRKFWSNIKTKKLMALRQKKIQANSYKETFHYLIIEPLVFGTWFGKHFKEILIFLWVNLLRCFCYEYESPLVHNFWVIKKNLLFW